MCLQCSVFTDLASQPLDVEVSDVMPVDAHFATLDVVETLQELNDRALAAAAVSNQSHCLARLYTQTDSLQNLSMKTHKKSFDDRLP